MDFPSPAAGGRLPPALALSVLLHVLLLWQAGPPRELVRPGLPQLEAVLRAAPPAAEAVPPPPARPAAAPARGAEKVSARGTALPPAVAPSPATAATGVQEVRVPEGVAMAQDTAEGTAAPPAAAAGGSEPGPDAEGLRRYRVWLARQARHHRHYPPLAREHGWSGTAEIEVSVADTGLPHRIAVVRSSGHEVLDREALAMMTQAAAATPLPASLRGQAFAVRLAVIFEMDGE